MTVGGSGMTVDMTTRPNEKSHRLIGNAANCPNSLADYAVLLLEWVTARRGARWVAKMRCCRRFANVGL